MEKPFLNALNTVLRLLVFTWVLGAIGFVQAQQSGFDFQGLPPSEDPPAQPDSVAIPRFEEGKSEAPAMRAAPLSATPLTEEVEAVEIPKELVAEPTAEPVAEEMANEADVEEKVSAAESTVKAIADEPVAAVPLSAEALRAKSEPTRSAQVGSSLLTRTEARTFTFSIPAPRGQLLDRNGYPLAQTKVAYYAAITFPFLGTAVTDDEIISYAGQRMQHVNKILAKQWDLPLKTVLAHYKERRWLPLTFSDVLTNEQLDELQRQKMEGLTMHPIYLRHYPKGAMLSHVIGYVGKRPPRTLGPIVNDEALWGEGIGVDGLEEAFEPELRGTPGRVNVLYEADGTKVKEDVLTRPKPGYNVVTSIDLEMQLLCEELLATHVKRGAMVITDVRNGDIVAMASNPQFDPNEFIPAITQERFSALMEDPAKPLFPRAFRACYPPASTFKVISALGFLESGYVSASDIYPCPSSWQIGSLVMRNWNTKDEGFMNVIGALTRSCNTWFYEVAVSAGADTMSYTATRFGLGQKTGVPLNDAPGFVPNNRYWFEKHGYLMSDGEEAVMSIGQGTVEVTPLQVARMMGGVGNGVNLMKPRLVLQVQDYNHEIKHSFDPEVMTPLNADLYALRTVQRGMYDVVNGGNGTGHAAYHKITVSGKTGTGQWKPAQEQNIAWFAGYFPSKHPVYSLAVIYEGEPGEKVSGGKNAGLVVGEFLERYLTEENYNRVRDASNEIKDSQPEESDSTFYRGPIEGIFQEAPGESVIQEIVPGQPGFPVQPDAQPGATPQPGGIFDGFFRRRR
jgi:penicillin-binding protein 2